ncbi:endo-alpha-(1-_5)-L-arabinanase, partial [Paenibacillus riograndensis]
VHQMFMNKEGWPVVAPHRYSGERIGKYTAKEISDGEAFIKHGKHITADIAGSKPIELTIDGKITGAVAGTWKLAGDHTAEMTVNGVVYSGVFLREGNEAADSQVMTFTAASAEGVSLWGSQE